MIKTNMKSFQLLPIFYLVCFVLALAPSGCVCCVSKSGLDAGDSDSNADADVVVVDDMIFSPRFNPRTGCVDENYRWPNATVVFNITKDFNEQELAIVWEGMQMISNETCVKFREKIREDPDVVEITKKPRENTPSGCSADIGRKGGLQRLHLAVPACLLAKIVAHELMHTLGVLHEHQRPDRDNYIEIHWDNIPQEFYAGFEKFNTSVASTFDVPYDFQSLMHYGPFDVSIDPSKPTISCRSQHSECKLGPSNSLTEFDKEKLRRMYKCTGTIHSS